MKCISCNPSDETNFIIASKFWIVTLSGDQANLGRSYIVSKRHCSSLSELNTDEWSELHGLIQKLDTTIKKAFGASMINLTCLMNTAYQESPPNPHVHWHFRPRYDHGVGVAGEQFDDPDFGRHYDRERQQRVNPKILQTILQKIKENL